MSARQSRTAALGLVGPLLATLLAVLVALGASALLAPAHAVEDEVPEPGEEEEEPPPDIDELCEEGTIAEEFCPETYEEPSWFQWLIYPLLIVGLVMVTLMLIAYLTWHPRFAKEREEKLRSRR